MIEVELVTADTAESLYRSITADLPEYFGLPEENENYAIGVRSCKNIAAKIGKDYIGLISLEFPYPNNCSVYWMAVLRKHHGQGAGRKLLESAYQLAIEAGASTMTVETLSPAESDEYYLKTYKFYQACGFKPLINLQPQGYIWNMVYMIRDLK